MEMVKSGKTTKEKWLKEYAATSPLHSLVLSSLTIRRDGDVGDLPFSSAEEASEVAGVNKDEVIRILKELSAHGFGKFLYGRRGYPNRLEWTVKPPSPVGLAKAAKPRQKAPETDAVRLSSGRQAIVPKDLTKEEILDLYAWARSLALD